MAPCATCRSRKGWQEGAGAQIVVEDAAVERALCDAQQRLDRRHGTRVRLPRHPSERRALRLAPRWGGSLRSPGAAIADATAAMDGDAETLERLIFESRGSAVATRETDHNKERATRLRQSGVEMV
jgi:hypothetical protein